MMGPMTNLSDESMACILDARTLRSEVAKELAESSTAVLLSAYITIAGAQWLIDTLPQNISLIVVGRFTPRDFKNGASDLEALRLLLSAKHTVKFLSTLHTKVLAIDNKIMFLGSSNYTARGLGLVDDHNLEASVKLELSSASKEFIFNIVRNSINITTNILDQFEEYLSGLDEITDDNLSNKWPAALFENIESLYVKDFPLAAVGEHSDIYTEHPNSDYSRLYESRNNYTLSRTIFRSSRSYIWLIQLLSKEENTEGISYGRLSSIIHDALLDDPAPYRRTVKDLQSNLYGFIREYADDVVHFYTPGNRSEFIKLYR